LSVTAINLYIYYGRREFSTENSYTKEYTEGKGGLHIYFILGPGEFNCYADMYFTPFSEGDVEITGLTRINYILYKNGVFAAGDTYNFVSPVGSWYAPNSVTLIFHNDNITVVGNARIKFQINETLYEEIFNYVLTIIPPLDISGGLYTQQLPLIWIEFIIILGILASCGISAGTISKIRSEIRYTQDMKEKDEEFFRFLRKRKKQ